MKSKYIYYIYYFYILTYVMRYIIYMFTMILFVLLVDVTNAQIKIITLTNTKIQSIVKLYTWNTWYYPLTKITFLPIVNSLSMPFDNMDDDQPKSESLGFGENYTDELGYNRGKHIWYDINKNPYTPVKAIGDWVVVASANYLGNKKLEVVFATGKYDTTRRETFTWYQTGIYISGFYQTWIIYYGYKTNRNWWWVVILAHKKPAISQNIINIYIQNNLTGSYISGISLPKWLSGTEDYDGIFYSVYGHIYNMPTIGSIITKWQVVWYISPANTPNNGYRKESHLHLGVYNISPWSKSILPGYYNTKNSDSILSGWMDPITFIYHYNN